MFVYLCYLQYIYSYKLTTYLIRVAGTGAAVCVLGGGTWGTCPHNLEAVGAPPPNFGLAMFFICIHLYRAKFRELLVLGRGCLGP